MGAVSGPRRRRLGGLAALVPVVALVLAVGLPATASGANVVIFGAASAKATFDTTIRFSQPYTSTASLTRVELLLTFGDASGPEVVPVPTTGLGLSGTLTDDVPVGGAAHLLPNTQIVAQWQVTTTAGDTQVGPSLSYLYADDRFQWQTETDGIVRVHWYQGDRAFATRAAGIGVDGIAAASQLLGVTETKPVDFFIYADETAFRQALGPGTRENVGGEADAGIRTLFALITPDQIDASWVGVVVPHELTHLVFDTASRNPYHDPPRWLNEGLAVYLSEGYGASDRGLVKSAASDGSLIPLTGLVGQFPTSEAGFRGAYAESVSAVDDLIRTYGRPALVTLIRSYASGQTDDEAFKAALGVDMTRFSDQWIADQGAKTPTRFGPQPAPAGPVPPGWGRGAAPGPTGSANAPSAAATGSASSTTTPSTPAGPTNDSSWDWGPAIVLTVVIGLLAVGGLWFLGSRREPR